MDGVGAAVRRVIFDSQMRSVRWARKWNLARITSGQRTGDGNRLKGIDADCNHIPDAAMTLAIVALFADGPSTLRNTSRGA